MTHVARRLQVVAKCPAAALSTPSPRFLRRDRLIGWRACARCVHCPAQQPDLQQTPTAWCRTATSSGGANICRGGGGSMRCRPYAWTSACSQAWRAAALRGTYSRLISPIRHGFNDDAPATTCLPPVDWLCWLMISRASSRGPAAPTAARLSCLAFSLCWVRQAYARYWHRRLGAAQLGEERGVALSQPTCAWSAPVTH